MVGKYRQILCFLLVYLLFSGAGAWVAAEEVIPLRLVALINLDDQGESINFPSMLYYDYWASETYLLSSTGRITIYDQKYFPVASFGKGRGMFNPAGMTVDRRGNIYVCQGADMAGSKPPRLTIYNQAFFPLKEIFFDGIPELVEFTPDKVAVAENGEIYLTGVLATEIMAGVAVLSPDGKFVRILRPPENNVWRAELKSASAVSKDNDKVAASRPETDSGDSADDSATALPAGLKPKPSASARAEEEDKGRLVPASITDVKIDRQGRVYLLSRSASLIYVLDAQGKYLFKFGEKGGVYGKLSNPVSLAIDLERRVIYVCDYMRHTILCYDYDGGKFIFEFGGRGLGPLWFNFPNYVEADQRGRVLVSDLFNRRVQVIDPSISERRPLTGALAEIAAGVRPSPEEVKLAPAQPEIAAPGAAELPAPVSVVTVPLVLAPSYLPAPQLPALMALSPLHVPLVAVSTPPLMPRPQSPRELAPVRFKKISVPAGPPLQIVTVAQVRSPVPIPRPAAVRFISEPGGRTSKVANGPPAGILARFRAMPAAVGVYGPVAALLGVGSWLLYTN
jgi:sugar lactone lactonase YvrE